MLRLVTPVLPDNSSTLHSSHLPLSGTLTPLFETDLQLKSRRDPTRPTCPLESPPPLKSIARCSSCYAFVNPTCALVGSRSFCCGLCGVTTMFMDALQVDEADLGAGQVSDGDGEQWSE